MAHFHAIVWIDHQEAKVFHFNDADADRVEIHPHDSIKYTQHKANETGTGHAPVDNEYLKRVGVAVEDAGAILIIGPAGTRKELASYLATHSPKVSERVVGNEPADHPTDGELVALGRKFFHAEERMQPQIPATS
jgi:hypothetical protein